MPDTLKAGIRTAIQAAVGLVILVATGLLQRVSGWVDVNLPYYSGEAKSLIIAVGSVFAGLVAFGGNWLMNKLRLGTTPEYTPAGIPPKEG